LRRRSKKLGGRDVLTLQADAPVKNTGERYILSEGEARIEATLREGQMEEIGDIGLAETRLLKELKEMFPRIRLAGKVEPTNLEVGLEILKALRQLVYEDMNQLQHEALILKLVKLLEADFYPSVAVRWFWNPRQTGHKDEPDLRGLDKRGQIIVSAEVTSSQSPQGLIDARMAKTLAKLSTMPGDKYYVVASEQMERRAKSKLSNLGYEINILRIQTGRES
jgi:hypothetical protein